jgi:hypothetical protein
VKWAGLVTALVGTKLWSLGRRRQDEQVDPVTPGEGDDRVGVAQRVVVQDRYRRPALGRVCLTYLAVGRRRGRRAHRDLDDLVAGKGLGPCELGRRAVGVGPSSRAEVVGGLRGGHVAGDGLWPVRAGEPAFQLLAVSGAGSNREESSMWREPPRTVCWLPANPSGRSGSRLIAS